MRLKTNRKKIYENQPLIQHGEGVREIAAWVLSKGKKGLVYARAHTEDILKLAAVAIKLYGGDTKSLMSAMKTGTEVFGQDELTALKNVIQDKHDKNEVKKPLIRKSLASRREDLKNAIEEPKKSDMVSIRERQPIEPKKVTKKMPTVRDSAIPAIDINEQIRSRPKLRPVDRSKPPRAEMSGLAGMLSSIKARRELIKPEENDDSDFEMEGIGAQRRLIKMAKHAMKHGASSDRTLPETKNYVVGGRLSDVLSGVSGVSGALSAIPGPHEIVTVPLSIIAGISSGIAKIFGKGMYGGMCGSGSMSDIKKIIYDRIVRIRKDMTDGGYIPSLKDLARQIVMDVVGVGSKALETKVRSMLGSGLKLPGKKYKGSGVLDIGVRFLINKILPKILHKMGLHLTKSDMDQLSKIVKKVIGTEPLTIKRAIEVAKELTPHLYRLYKGRQAGTGLKMSGGKLTAMVARQIIKGGH
jgi:hypothetical protein